MLVTLAAHIVRGVKRVKMHRCLSPVGGVTSVWGCGMQRKQVRGAAVGVMFLSVVQLTGCSKATTTTEPASNTDAATVAAPGPVVPANDEEAADVVAVLRALYPHECAVNAVEQQWSVCRDEVKGYDAMLACVERMRPIARKVAERAPAPLATTACGMLVETAILDHVSGFAPFVNDFADWTRQNRAKLATAMRGETFPDSCSGTLCDGAPDMFESARYPKLQPRLNALECTVPLFVCQYGGKCTVPKVTSRLGLACDPKENTFSTLTGARAGTRFVERGPAGPPSLQARSGTPPATSIAPPGSAGRPLASALAPPPPPGAPSGPPDSPVVVASSTAPATTPANAGDAKPSSAGMASAAGSFDRKAAATALARVDLNSCGSSKFGSGHASVTFAPDGSAKEVVVDGGNFANTREESCILTMLNAVHVPPFQGAPVRVGRSFTLREH